MILLFYKYCYKSNSKTKKKKRRIHITQQSNEAPLQQIQVYVQQTVQMFSALLKRVLPVTACRSVEKSLAVLTGLNITVIARV